MTDEIIQKVLRKSGIRGTAYKIREFSRHSYWYRLAATALATGSYKKRENRFFSGE